MKKLLTDFRFFLAELGIFLFKVFHIQFIRVETRKSAFVSSLYRQRGKLARRLMHSGMAGITGFGVMIAPIVAQEFPRDRINPWDAQSPTVLSATTDVPLTDMDFSNSQFRDKTVQYTVVEGDTISTIAQKFGVDEDTILWQNDLGPKDKIKVGQSLEILPVTGISHKVRKGDTVHSIAKKYDSDAQAIVNFPFNTFVNDETFELAIGQTIIIPDGVKPEEAAAPIQSRIKQLTPDAGTVVASGQFVWPTKGVISQRFAWYHQGIDIANREAPDVYAADAGKVIIAGWIDNTGYGNRVIIDHANGTKTLYAHLQKIYVVPGQTVSRGAAIGKMGSTGRSTGTHLHFEIIQGSGKANPLNVLK